MGGFLVRGILIGLLFGIPVGAVGTLTVQRTFRYGFAAGLKTGMGSSAADCLYAACGAFGLTLLSDFLLKYQTAIRIAGVFTGTFLWWCILSASVVFLKRKTGNQGFRYRNRVFGTILILFGTVIFIRTI